MHTYQLPSTYYAAMHDRMMVSPEFRQSCGKILWRSLPEPIRGVLFGAKIFFPTPKTRRNPTVINLVIVYPSDATILFAAHHPDLLLLCNATKSILGITDIRIHGQDVSHRIYASGGRWIQEIAEV